MPRRRLRGTLNIYLIMKTLRKIGYVLAAVCLCFNLVSCSEDGPEAGDGNCTVKLGSESFKTPYGFWHMGYEDSDESAGDNFVMMEFYNFNPLSGNYPSMMSAVAIEYEVPAGQKEISSAVIKGGDYHVYIAHKFAYEDGGIDCENDYKNPNDPDLKIVRNGDSYSISVEGLKVGDDDTPKYDFSFNFSGKLTHRQIAQ